MLSTSSFQTALILLRTLWDSHLLREKRETPGGQQHNHNNPRSKKVKDINFTRWRISAVCLSQQLVFWVSKLSQGKGAFTLKVKSKLINLGEASRPEYADSPLQGGQSQQEKGICSANKKQDEYL